MVYAIEWRVIFPLQIDDSIHGNELWKTDGTEEGTTMVKDIRDGSDSSNPYGFTEFNGELYFVADDGVHGFELWKTDGTGIGTILVADIDEDYDSYPWLLQNLTVNCISEHLMDWMVLNYGRRMVLVQS